MIEEIEQVDKDWWYGVGGGGAKCGLFPCEPDSQMSFRPCADRGRSHSANYVEVVGAEGVVAIAAFE